MPNLSRAEMEEMQEALISADDGSLITAVDHRAYNSAMMDFTNSFLPKDLEVNGEGENGVDGNFGSITDEALEKRDVSSILLIESNILITPTGFNKASTASDTVTFIGGNYIVQGTLVTINFKRT